MEKQYKMYETKLDNKFFDNCLYCLKLNYSILIKEKAIKKERFDIGLI